MPTTIPGLFLIVLAVLPGAAYTWGVERQAGSFGAQLSDRVLRFVGASLVFGVVLSWSLLGIYRWLIKGTDPTSVGAFVGLWLSVVLVTALPFVCGLVVGGLYSTRGERAGWFGIRRWLSTRREQQLVQALLGRTPAPRAWDDYFSDRPNAYLRVRTHEGTWLAGRFAEDSYAAGFPQEPDLLLEEAWGIDQESGALGREGLGYGLYVPTTSIAWIEIVREPADGAGG